MSLWFLTLREKFPNTELLLIRKQENTDQKLLRIWTLYAQCYFFEDCTVTIKIADRIILPFYQNHKRAWKKC